MSNIEMCLSDIDTDIEMLVDKDWFENIFKAGIDDWHDAIPALTQTLLLKLTPEETQCIMRTKSDTMSYHDAVAQLVVLTLSDYTY